MNCKSLLCKCKNSQNKKDELIETIHSETNREIDLKKNKKEETCEICEIFSFFDFFCCKWIEIDE